jgi:glycosyltransferase involved in cell wall biosynthesis
MLSIAIPIFNFDVRELVNTIHQQALKSGHQFEILCTDDGSDESYKMLNKKLSNLSSVSYHELSKNIGRSAIRNLLAKKAQYPYILFMDCDSRIISDHYISNYLRYCKGQELVVCGGRSYNVMPPVNSNAYFRWYYGVNREVKDAGYRSQNPNRSFMTNNFLITKSVLEKISFDNNIKGYGHEDTLMGYELKKQNVKVIHINNPLSHIGLESSKAFLVKSRQAVSNLQYLLSRYKADTSIINEDIKILKYYTRLADIGVTKPLGIFYKYFKKAMVGNLLSSRPNLAVFDLYKLSYLASINQKAVSYKEKIYSNRKESNNPKG